MRLAWVPVTELAQRADRAGGSVRHQDGSTGVLLDSITGVRPGLDILGEWRVPVEWRGGPQSVPVVLSTPVRDAVPAGRWKR